jgi:TonB family protein
MQTGPKKPLRLLCFLFLILLGYCVGPAAVTGQESERKVLKKVEAKYPDILRKKNIGGTVRLKALVKADGTVKSVDVVGGNPILADSAKNAVLQWKFAPGSGETSVDVAMNFDPNNM